MSQIRKAHSVEIIDRRLKTCETAGVDDVMELIGLHDELARVERKWLEKAVRHKVGDVGGRPLSDAGQLNARFARLTRLVDAAVRRQTGDSAERAMLDRTASALHARKPVEAAQGSELTPGKKAGSHTQR